MLAATLRQVIDAVGAARVEVLALPAGDQVPVSRTQLLEPREELSRAAHAVLLAVGVRPTGKRAADVVTAAAEAGMSAVVVKPYGDSATRLATTAERVGIALLSIDESLTWQQLDGIVSSALAVGGRDAGGGFDPHAADLFGLANAIATSVGGATTIEDPHMRILAYSSVGDLPIDEERQQGILGLQVPYAPGNESQYRTLARTSGVCRFPAEPGGLPRLAVAIRAGDELLGSLWVVDADSAFGAEAERRLTTAADFAALHLLRGRTIRDLANQRHGELLRRLFDDPASAVLVAPQLGLAPDTPVVVVAFAIVTDDPDGVLASRAAQLLTDLVSLHYLTHYGRHGCALIGGTLYALLPADSARDGRRELIEDIVRRARAALGLRVNAALGSVVAELRSAVTSRREADVVLRVLSVSERDEGAAVVAAIDDVRAPVFLAELADRCTDPTLPAGLATRIHSYDRAHGTAYARTLAAYFDANTDIAAAARRLNVHANTCRYRIGRIGDLFGIDLADPDQRLVLWLELRLDRRPSTSG